MKKESSHSTDLRAMDDCAEKTECRIEEVCQHIFHPVFPWTTCGQVPLAICQSGFRQGGERLAYYLVIVGQHWQPTIFSGFWIRHVEGPARRQTDSRVMCIALRMDGDCV